MAEDDKGKPYRAWLRPLTLVMAVLALILLAAAIVRWARSGVEPEPTEAPIGLTAAELAAAYDRDRAAVEEALRGRTILVRGRYRGSASFASGDPVIRLESGNPLLEVSAVMEQVHAPWIAGLEEGAAVTISCAGISPGVLAPALQDCEPVDGR